MPVSRRTATTSRPCCARPTRPCTGPSRAARRASNSPRRCRWAAVRRTRVRRTRAECRQGCPLARPLVGVSAPAAARRRTRVHDAAGNLVEETRGGVVVTRRYDGQGRVVELRRPTGQTLPQPGGGSFSLAAGSWRYAYNGPGQRVVKQRAEPPRLLRRPSRLCPAVTTRSPWGIAWSGSAILPFDAKLQRAAGEAGGEAVVELRVGAVGEHAAVGSLQDRVTALEGGQRADAGEGAPQSLQAQASRRQQARGQGVQAAGGTQQALPQQLQPTLWVALV
ncbi:RHS repeat protein [Arenimonas fontis]|uniref:RHS repeat protein n=1 Tax=Arenimonas fontis TaxID=2608255 RepID=A0A5B2ZD36_9GAMM|nr:RHS repeat protein [Arenimonas fontis]